MDPNATLQRIFDAAADNDREEYEQAWDDLLEWLRVGGFPPALRELPPSRYGPGEYFRGPRNSLGDAKCAIMSREVNHPERGFMICAYNGRGDETARWILPLA